MDTLLCMDCDALIIYDLKWDYEERKKWKKLKNG